MIAIQNNTKLITTLLFGSVLTLSGAVQAKQMRIIGGKEAVANTYPWMVSLQSKGGGHFCGASLIDKHWVLTASHCVESESAEGMEVVVSEYHLQQQSKQEQRIGIEQVVMHKDYNGDTVDNDIALLRLKEPVNISVIPTIDTKTMATLADGTLLTVMGWGNQLTDGEKFPDVLNEVKVELANQKVCNDNYAQESGGQGQITENMLCAGYAEGGKDSCQGDSGGPLVFQRDNQFFQVGIVSWGAACAAPKLYGVYTRLAQYTDWISNAKAGKVENGHNPGAGGNSSGEGDDTGWEDGSWDDSNWEDADSGWEDGDWDNGDWDQSENPLAATLGLPDYLSFFALGDNNDSLDLLLTNSSEQAVELSSVTLEGSELFALTANNCTEQALAPNNTCQLTLQYTASEQVLENQDVAIDDATEFTDDPEYFIELFDTAFMTITTVQGENTDVLLEGITLSNDSSLAYDWDDAMFEPEDSESFDPANDTAEFFSGGDVAWTLQDGEFVSGDVEQGQNSILLLSIEGPGELSFDMALSGVAGESGLEWFVDGELVQFNSGEKTINSRSLTLAEGKHKVMWVFSKPESDTNTATTNATITRTATTKADARIAKLRFKKAQADTDASGSTTSETASAASASAPATPSKGSSGGGGAFGIWLIGVLASARLFANYAKKRK